MILFWFFFFLFLLMITLLILNFFFSKKLINSREKSSPFECGFDPLNSSRLPFSIQFYLISIIFLIFDVEIIIFLPLISSYPQIPFSSWLNMSIYFIFMLLIGLYIEWDNGALYWLK